ncbi:MAG: 3-hydroxybutyryl-CoA dehydrogenase [Calditrichaeota bacterium]|nr:3-hydroxybutyryl-CoA dehydrogenase [Calditrichota bacterium]
MEFDASTRIGVIGAGTMGSGIAQLAAMNDHTVYLVDINNKVLKQSKSNIENILKRMESKGKIRKGDTRVILDRIVFEPNLENMNECQFIMEAIAEKINLKRDLIYNLEKIIDKQTVIASNTSSLSIAAIASASKRPEQILGAHFFNPAPIMPLVEVIPGVMTDDDIVSAVRKLIDGWGKTTVLAKDTPGFIVNRVARPFYGEAIRMLEEGLADAATIDWAVKEIGGFRMGPFELMDFIGNDVNYTVTESIFAEFFYDPRFKPSFTQKRMVEAGLLGRKTGRGYYDYHENSISAKTTSAPKTDKNLGSEIFDRILCMLINEAADAVFLNIASKEDVDLAMTLGVSYPKGLLKWADEIRLDNVLNTLIGLQEEYGEDRYRPNPLLKRMARKGMRFYD